jgi:hypothetical protein
MLEAAALQKNDVAVGLIEENLRYAPELMIFPSRVIAGTNYEAVIASGDPTVGFTAANDGPALTKTTLRKETVTCGIFRGAVEIDLAVERASQGSGLPSLESIESSRIAQAAMRYIGRQIFYGTSYDSKGFVGLKAFTPKTAAAGTSEIVVDATGTGSAATSIYAVKFGIQDIHLVFGANQTLELSDFRDQQLTNSTTGGKFAGRVAELTAYIGMQRININSVGRILNVTTDSGKTASDSLLSQLLEKFPVGFTPDAFFMSRRSHGQLARSRPVTIFSQPGVAPGANSRTPPIIATSVPDFNGIPVVVTDSILNTDTAE